MKKGNQASIEETEEGFIERLEVVVDGGQTPLRIDKFLLDRLERTSRNRIQLGIKAGAITVNGNTVKSNYKVRPNDAIEVLIPRTRMPGQEIVGEDIPLNIVYEDDHLMVINKPAGMVVHPGIGNFTGTLVHAIKHHLDNQDLPVLPSNPLDRPGLVHRIDKDTTGLMVVAKTEYALTHLAKQFYDHTVERSYVTLVWGQPDEERGVVSAPIGRDPKNRTQQAVFEEGEGGKHAITHWEILQPMYYVSLLRCRLETGRTHQIRVHMQHMGNPVFNDPKYGGNRVRKGTVFQKYKQFVHNCFKMVPHHVLHAATLGFVHPESKEPMRFEEPLPADFRDLVDKWYAYVSNVGST
ncbi:MAG: RluA family pseudouridine synthase [Saprospiraceae bacterium]|nr:RluA family pseudouridine synthase [Saprospiraceae bacterium]